MLLIHWNQTARVEVLACSETVSYFLKTFIGRIFQTIEKVKIATIGTTISSVSLYPEYADLNSEEIYEAANKASPAAAENLNSNFTIHIMKIRNYSGQHQHLPLDLWSEVAIHKLCNRRSIQPI